MLHLTMTSKKILYCTQREHSDSDVDCKHTRAATGTVLQATFNIHVVYIDAQTLDHKDAHTEYNLELLHDYRLLVYVLLS